MRIFRPVFLAFLFIFPTLFPFSQPGKPPAAYLSVYQKAEKLYHSPAATEITDSIAKSNYLQVADMLYRENLKNAVLSDSYLKTGILSMTANDPVSALLYFQQSIFVVSQNHRLPDSLLFQPFLYSGSVHYSLNHLDSAIYYYKKAEEINQRYKRLPESERLYNKFGALYFETGDYNKSIPYFEKALSLEKEKPQVNNALIINYKNNLATALMKLGRYDEALEIFNELLTYPHPADELLFNAGNTYFEKGNDAEALIWLRKIRTMQFEKYSSLVNLFIRERLYDSAGFYLRLAKQYYVEHKTRVPGFAYGIIMKYSGDLNMAAGKESAALNDYQESILLLDPSFQDRSVLRDPMAFSGLGNFLFLFDALSAKAAAWEKIYNRQPELKMLEQSLQTYNSALTLVSHIENSWSSDDARFFLTHKVNPVVRQAVTLSIRLYKKTKDRRFLKMAFGFVENNKATVLQAGLKGLELSALPGLPVELVEKEKILHSQLARLSVVLAQSIDSLSSTSIQQKMHDLEIELSGLQNKLDENPVYHALRFNRLFPDMDSVQKNIKDPDEAILSYYYTDSLLICFYIMRDETGVFVSKREEAMLSDIHSLRRALQDPEATGNKYLREAGSSLFGKMVEPVYEKIGMKDRLIILPYNEIGYIPFDMLIDRKGYYLLKHYAISYNYSANFLMDRKTQKKTAYQVLAMAPFSESAAGQTDLPALPYSAEEMKGIKQGKIFVGEEATKATFLELCSGFPIIHLATHAVANDSNLLGTYIEFYGSKKTADSLRRLYVPEIYATDLKSARLVILSACETGNGELVNGEGIMSLSRAFSYAGCKSVITSLWKADEISTSYITTRLHSYIRKGNAVDEALQKAKLDYLADKDIPERFKNPAYWAHLMLIGDFNSITGTGFPWWYWVFIVAAAGAGVIGYQKKKNQA